jgi:hypothetical protein
MKQLRLRLWSRVLCQKKYKCPAGGFEPRTSVLLLLHFTTWLSRLCKHMNKKHESLNRFHASLNDMKIVYVIIDFAYDNFLHIIFYLGCFLARDLVKAYILTSVTGTTDPVPSSASSDSVWSTAYYNAEKYPSIHTVDDITQTVRHIAVYSAYGNGVNLREVEVFGFCK